ncbi:MAG: hypothetical protein HPY52_03375 [Firmicutes bacterium]|nr:hypothetical protein [Bacillota bacterium]
MPEEAREILEANDSGIATDADGQETQMVTTSEETVLDTSRAAETMQPEIPQPHPAPKRRRHRFTDNEDNMILKAREVERGGRKETLKKIAQTLGMRQSSVERRYYFLLRREKVTHQKSARGSMDRSPTLNKSPNGGAQVAQQPSFFKSDEEFLQTLITLPARVAALEERTRNMLDLKGFIEHLVEVDRQFEREQQLLDELAAKDEEIHRLKEDMQARIERLNRREEELNEIYQLLEITFQQFMNLSSLDKLRVLGDFTVKIETVIDKFGNIIRRRPIAVR